MQHYLSNSLFVIHHEDKSTRKVESCSLFHLENHPAAAGTPGRFWHAGAEIIALK